MTTMQRAREFAQRKHAGQKYDGGCYVRNHLDHVVEVLTRFGVTDPALLTAGYLHDTLEDTETTAAELVEAFGDDVAHLVVLLTDNKTGKNRRERQERTYQVMRPYPRAVVVKLGDRIGNVEASLRADGKSFFGMYRKEYDFFRGALYNEWNAMDPIIGGMWEHLDKLMKSEWVVLTPS